MKITSFDGLALTQYEIDDNIPLTFSGSQRVLPGQAGAYDDFGREQYRDPLTITRSYELMADTYADIDDQLDALRAKANKGLGWLVIEMRDGDTRGAWAKLKRVEAPYQPEFYQHLPVDLTFEVNWPWFEDEAHIWYLDAGQMLDDGLSFDSNYSTRTGAGTLTITNSGGDVIRRGMIVVKGYSLNPTITNAANGYSIAYQGSFAAGTTLFIDVGARKVTLAGVSNPYANIVLGDNQVDFFRLETGANVLTFAGGGTLEYHWAEVY